MFRNCGVTSGTNCVIRVYTDKGHQLAIANAQQLINKINENVCYIPSEL